MDDGPRARLLPVALCAGFLVVAGAGCSWSSPLVWSTPSMPTLIQPVAVTPSLMVEPTSTVPVKVPVEIHATSSTSVDWYRVNRICDLKMDDLAHLFGSTSFDSSAIRSKLEAEQTNGWNFDRICFDHDEWKPAEDQYTIYFSLTKYPDGKSDSIVPHPVQVRLGVWSIDFQFRPLKLSDPVVIDIAGTKAGFDSLDLEKHYSNNGIELVPTVYARHEVYGNLTDTRDTYVFRPPAKKLQKTFSCVMRPYPSFKHRSPDCNKLD